MSDYHFPSTGVQETGRHPNQIRVLDTQGRWTLTDLYHMSSNKTLLLQDNVTAASLLVLLVSTVYMGGYALFLLTYKASVFCGILRT